MSEDHLDKETSISAELTETGVKAAAKSRAVASFDRLLGSISDAGSAWFEGVSGRRRAKTEGERQLIDATAKYGIERLRMDEAFASRAFENHFKKVAQQQLNKDAVVAEAIEDLRRTPPTDEEATTGPEAVSEEFISRFESFAEGATSEELRERWGRILAGEIRKPGTFNRKVLRATDELDPSAAALFESLMPYRMRNLLVISIMPNLSLDQRLSLISSGLIADPGFAGHRNEFQPVSLNGEDAWATSMGNIVMSFPKSVSLLGMNNDVIAVPKKAPAYSVLILTDIGIALSSILPSDERLVAANYAKRLKLTLSSAEITFWRQEPERIVKIPWPLYDGYSA
ncbi:DUF2806 domain-containing protein [Rhizobium leguminosarum]|uniref:DUF2806 domain-containing protein n=1 Tax=Rhizobium leguminosarum TaxID=384 RepID=UPI00140FD7F3|nr:DUF2806 domain-containing protein [Rhizobium leguminosarum]QIO64790.1 DUF2806 domain-containing protein [Rhizobium leguminosarum bv. trifolii]